MIPYGRQDISQADIDAVVRVLKSDFLTQGSAIPSFEKAVSLYSQAHHAIAVNSATSALHIACLALGLGPGDQLWTSPTTFVASANCARYCGATVDFVDIDPNTYNLSVELLAEKLRQAEKLGNLPKIVMPIHLCGQSSDMAGIYALSQQYGFKIIEDASHAIGGKYKDKPVGSCQFSDIAVFSFHPVKIITTGEGGMALTNDSELADRMRQLSTHGITNNPEVMHPRPDNEIWNYQQTLLGFNFRMTDIQAALGESQMSRLDEFVDRRHLLAQRYDENLADLPIQLPWQHPDCHSSYHLYPIRLELNEIKKTQREVYDLLREASILTNLHYIPVYRHPYYESMGFKRDYCREAEEYFRQALSIPLYFGMSEDQQELVISSLTQVLQT